MAQDYYSPDFKTFLLFAGDTKICAGNGQVDTCNGDSGGALLANNAGVSYIVQISSGALLANNEGVSYTVQSSSGALLANNVG